MSLGQIAGAAGQQRQALLEALQDLAGGERLDPCGGQLERKGQLVEPTADGGHGIIGRELGIHRPGPRHEQVHALLVGEWRHGVLLLTADTERLPAGDEQIEIRAGGEQAGDIRGRLDHLLEIVQEEEHAPPGDVLGQAIPGAEHTLGRRQDQVVIAQRRERHPPDAVRIATTESGRRLCRQACLASAARSRQGEQVDVVAGEEIDHPGQLPLAAQKRRGRDRQVGLVQALEWREVSLAQLEDAFGRGEVLQPVLAQVAHVVPTHDGGRGRRDEHLPTVAAGSDPGRPVHVDANVAFLGQMRAAGVDAHAHPDRARGQSGLGRLRRSQSTGGRGEGDEDGIALRIDLDAAVGTARLTQDAAMFRECAGIGIGAQRLKQPGGTLHVGEQEGDGSGGQVAPHGRHHAPGWLPRGPGPGPPTIRRAEELGLLADQRHDSAVGRNGDREGGADIAGPGPRSPAIGAAEQTVR